MEKSHFRWTNFRGEDQAGIKSRDQQIISLQGAAAKACVVGFGKSYLFPNRFNGLDQVRLKGERPEIYQQYFVPRETGGLEIRACLGKREYGTGRSMGSQNEGESQRNS
jgi:hypothetical protein